MINPDQLRILLREENWTAVDALLDNARDQALTNDDLEDAAYWRVVALIRARRYSEALDFLRKHAGWFNCQSWVHHKCARILIELGLEKDALEELRKAPIEAEMEAFYGLAIDAKFTYLFLLARFGDPSVKERFSEIPDDYQQIAIDGTFLTKADIISLLN